MKTILKQKKSKRLNRKSFKRIGVLFVIPVFLVSTIAPFVPNSHVQADSPTSLAYVYNDNNQNVTNMVNGQASAFNSSGVLVRGSGIFSKITNFDYQGTALGGYRYSDSYYCINSNVQTASPGSSHPLYYAIQVSINFQPNMRFNEFPYFNNTTTNWANQSGTYQSDNSYIAMITGITKNPKNEGTNSPISPSTTYTNPNGQYYPSTTINPSGQTTNVILNQDVAPRVGITNRQAMVIPTSCLSPYVQLAHASSMINLENANTSAATIKSWGLSNINSGLSSSANGLNNPGSQPTLTCSVGLFNPLSWLLCPIVNGLVGIIGDVDNLITNLLSVGGGNNSANPSSIFCDAASNSTTTCGAYYSAWSEFRNIALGLLVIVGLIAIVTEALGMEILDAYTIRKVLPRLVFAAIAITLSWELMRFFVELTNAIGFGIRYLIYAPFEQLNTNINLGGGGGFAVDLATSAAISAMSIVGLLSFAATAAIAVFVAFLTLVIRQLLIILLIILAPIAILAYILPNTQKVFKLWWDSFSKALFMFPIIVALIAIGRVFASVTLYGHSGNAIYQIIAFAAYFGPYFAVPFTVRFAGGALSQIGGFVHNAHRGAYGAVSGFRKRQISTNMQKLAQGRRWNEDHALSPVTRRLNRLSRGAANIGHTGFNPMRARSRMQAAISTQEYAHAKEDLEKNTDVQAIVANDDYNQAVLASLRNHGEITDQGVREHLESVVDGQGNHIYTGRSLEQGVAAIRQARHSTSNDALAIAATIANPATGTGFAGGAGQMYEAINLVAGQDRHLAARMLADSRSAAERSRRVDLSGNGFGEGQRLMQDMLNGNMTADDASTQAIDTLLNIQGVGAIMNARGNAVRNIVPHLTGRVVNAQNGVNLANRQVRQAINDHGSGSREHQLALGNLVNARQDLNRQLATVAGLYDASAYAAPEVSEELSQVLNRPLAINNNDGQPEVVSIGQMVENARSATTAPGQQSFLDLRREIGQQAAAAGRNSQVMVGQGGPPTMQPPTLQG
jgi:hypothetical protein